MKTSFLKINSLILFLIISMISCDSDDDSTPEIINEEEVITTVVVILTPDAGGAEIELRSVDLDAEGPQDPVVTVSGPLTASTTYSGTVSFLNETEDPAENITLEVEEEDEDHQVIFTVASSLNVTTAYSNFDDDGNALGTAFELTTGAPGSGNFTVTLRHEPTKPNNGTLDDAGGETDAQVIFPLEVQ